MNLWLPSIYDYLAGRQPSETTQMLIGWFLYIVIHTIYAVAIVTFFLVVAEVTP